MRNYHPVIYIRGYAMTDEDVESTFNLPYYGFNLGSTQYRQGPRHEPEMHIFESPVIRLLKDHGYIDAFGPFCDAAGKPIPRSVGENQWRKTLWVFRYYDPESSMYEEERPTFPVYAARLLAYLARVREACHRPDDFKVNLVAHSMGGLIARCYLQGSGTKPFKEALETVKQREVDTLEDDPRDGRSAGEKRRAVDELLASPVAVNKLFTYATPHRGIAFRGLARPVNRLRDLVGNFREDQFTPRYMARYLGPAATRSKPHAYKPRRHAPPLEKTFSLVGTNSADYTVRSARAAVGPKSDGLVLTENAYLHAGPRACVHRAHSGPLGIVNSEPGYQNLQRFLFGNRRFQLRLRFGHVTPQPPDDDADAELRYLLLDLAVALRGVPGYLDQRSEQAMTAEPIELERAAHGHRPKGERAPVLFTGYLFADAVEEEANACYRTAGDAYARWLLDLSIKPRYESSGTGLFGFGGTRSRFEGDRLFHDRVEFALADAGTDPPLLYRWHTDPEPDPRPAQPLEGAAKEAEAQGSAPVAEQARRYAIALPSVAERHFRGVDLLLEIARWT